MLRYHYYLAWTVGDSNSSPLECKTSALPNELTALIDILGVVPYRHSKLLTTTEYARQVHMSDTYYVHAVGNDPTVYYVHRFYTDC